MKEVTLRVKCDVCVTASQPEAEMLLAQWLRHMADQIEQRHPLPCETYHPAMELIVGCAIVYQA